MEVQFFSELHIREDFLKGNKKEENVSATIGSTIHAASDVVALTQTDSSCSLAFFSRILYEGKFYLNDPRLDLLENTVYSPPWIEPISNERWQVFVVPCDFSKISRKMSAKNIRFW